MKPRVQDAMTRDLVAVGPETSLSAVARLLELHGISGVPVVDEEARPLGVVSKTDLLARNRPQTRGGSATYYRLWNGQVRVVGTVADDGMGPAGRVRDVMTPHAYAIDPQDDLYSAAERMTNEGVHRLLVLEGGRVIGMLAATDCLRVLAG